MNVLLSPVALAIIFVISTARTARLITYDDFPPMEAFRNWATARMGAWSKVMVCPFCMAPYLVAANLVWFLALYHHHDAFIWFWLLPHLWWAASYLAAIVVAYDQPDE